MSSERPKNLSKDELEQYDVLLEEQAFPFEEKAIKLHEVNAARTKDGTYDEWVQKSFAALAQLNPGRYGKVEIGEQQVESTSGTAIPPGAAGASGGPAATAMRRPSRRRGTAICSGAATHEVGTQQRCRTAVQTIVRRLSAIGRTQLNLGLLYLRDSRLSDAESAFKTVLAHNPASATAAMNSESSSAGSASLPMRKRPMSAR